MSESKMTPGPWRFTERLNQAYDVMADVAICRMFVDRAINGRAYQDGESAANARAIACLPELIEAARHVMAMNDDAYLTGHPEWEVITDEMRRILARIDGEGA